MTEPSVPTITGIAHYGVRVHDLERSRAFYGLLGFELVAGPMGPEPVAVLTHPSGIEVNLVLNAAHASAPNVLMDVEEKHPGYTHVALRVSDVKATQTALEAAGVALTEGPVTFPGGAVSIFVRDPDRNVIEFNQAASLDSAEPRT
jgi:lactoylglutathione lyase